VGTLPTAGQSAKETDLIRLRESKGNQFIMPDITGQFWDDLLPQLQSLGWTGAANTVQTPAGDDNRAKVLRQDPPPGTPIRKDGNISLTFGQ
jgi:serine/threonine-protein kinase